MEIPPPGLRVGLHCSECCRLPGELAEQLSESYACLSMAGRDLVLVGLDTGHQCTLTRASTDVGSSSMTWLGDDAYTCSGDWNQLTETSVADGTVTSAQHYCSAALVHGSS
ncbi:MAG: hypothetical protein ABIO70_28455 [Pseudomonadota bacterium]